MNAGRVSSTFRARQLKVMCVGGSTSTQSDSRRIVRVQLHAVSPHSQEYGLAWGRR